MIIIFTKTKLKHQESFISSIHAMVWHTEVGSPTHVFSSHSSYLLSSERIADKTHNAKKSYTLLPTFLTVSLNVKLKIATIIQIYYCIWLSLYYYVNASTKEDKGIRQYSTLWKRISLLLMLYQSLFPPSWLCLCFPIFGCLGISKKASIMLRSIRGGRKC